MPSLFGSRSRWAEAWRKLSFDMSVGLSKPTDAGPVNIQPTRQKEPRREYREGFVAPRAGGAPASTLRWSRSLPDLLPGPVSSLCAAREGQCEGIHLAD